MIRTLSIAFVATGFLSCLAAGASAINCVPGQVFSPARCVPAGQNALIEQDGFAYCMATGEGSERRCVPAPESLCGSFNGFGQPRAGACAHSLLLSNPDVCQENVAAVMIKLDYWVGGCAFESLTGECSCVYTVKADQAPAYTYVCNCSLF